MEPATTSIVVTQAYVYLESSERDGRELLQFEHRSQSYYYRPHRPHRKTKGRRTQLRPKEEGQEKEEEEEKETEETTTKAKVEARVKAKETTAKKEKKSSIQQRRKTKKLVAFLELFQLELLQQ